MKNNIQINDIKKKYSSKRKNTKTSLFQYQDYSCYINLRDIIFDSLWISKFNQITILSKGKKEKAESILYKSFKLLKLVYNGLNSFPIFFESTEKLKGVLEVRKVRLGRNVIPIPVYIIGRRRIKITLLKFRKAFLKRSELMVSIRILKEIYSSFRALKGSYVCQLEVKLWGVLYNNRAFMHYRWY